MKPSVAARAWTVLARKPSRPVAMSASNPTPVSNDVAASPAPSATAIVVPVPPRRKKG